MTLTWLRRERLLRRLCHPFFWLANRKSKQYDVHWCSTYDGDSGLIALWIMQHPVLVNGESPKGGPYSITYGDFIGNVSFFKEWLAWVRIALKAYHIFSAWEVALDMSQNKFTYANIVSETRKN